MRILLFATMLMFAVEGFAADREDEAGSTDIDKCFQCNKAIEDGLKSGQKKQAVERATDVYGKAPAPTGSGDSDATREQPGK